MPARTKITPAHEGVAATPPAGTLYWTIPNESWQHEWASWSAQAKTRVTDRYTTHLPSGMNGRFALRCDITDGDVAYSQGDMSQATYNPLDGPWGERAEVAMEYPPRYLPGTFTRDPDFNSNQRLHVEGQTTYISWQMYLPSSFPLDLTLIPTNYWQNVMQWKGVNGAGIPMLLLQPNGGNWDLQHWTLGSLGTVPAVRDVWARFTMYTVWSPGAGTGKVQLWVDTTSSGTMAQMVPLTTCATMETPVSGAATSQTRMGIYRNSIVPGSTWAAYFGYTVATTRDLAEFHAFTKTAASLAPSYTRQTIGTTATLIGTPTANRKKLTVTPDTDAQYPVYLGDGTVTVGSGTRAGYGQSVSFTNDELSPDGGSSWYGVAKSPTTVTVSEEWTA